MSKIFQDAVAEAATLPDALQDKIGQELHSYVGRLRRLRTDIAQGTQSLDRGAGQAVDIEAVIRRARARHGEG